MYLDVVALVGLLCTVVGLIVAILKLTEYPRFRFVLLTVFIGITTAFVWTVTHGSYSTTPAIVIQQERVKALQQAARDEARREIEVQHENEEKEEEARIYEAARVEALKNARLQEAQRAILGSWDGGWLTSKLTFNSDGTVSTFIPHSCTYHFLDANHVSITSLWGYGIPVTYEVQATGPDQYVRWHGVTWRRSSP
jgi:hypothetical protein